MTEELFEALRWLQEHRTFPWLHIYLRLRAGRRILRGAAGKFFKEGMNFIWMLCKQTRGRPFGFYASDHPVLTGAVRERDLGIPAAQILIPHGSVFEIAGSS